MSFSSREEGIDAAMIFSPAPARGFEPHPLGYQPFDSLPFYPFQFQTGWYPWAVCCPFFPQSFRKCLYQYVVVFPPLAASVRYPWGKCRPFVSPRFSKENGAVKCTCSVYVWGGSLVRNISNFRMRIGRTYYFKMLFSKAKDEEDYNNISNFQCIGQYDYVADPLKTPTIALV